MVTLDAFDKLDQTQEHAGGDGGSGTAATVNECDRCDVDYVRSTKGYFTCPVCGSCSRQESDNRVNAFGVPPAARSRGSVGYRVTRMMEHLKYDQRERTAYAFTLWVKRVAKKLGITATSLAKDATDLFKSIQVNGRMTYRGRVRQGVLAAIIYKQTVLNELGYRPQEIADKCGVDQKTMTEGISKFNDIAHSTPFQDSMNECYKKIVPAYVKRLVRDLRMNDIHDKVAVFIADAVQTLQILSSGDITVATAVVVYVVVNWSIVLPFQEVRAGVAGREDHALTRRLDKIAAGMDDPATLPGDDSQRVTAVVAALSNMSHDTCKNALSTVMKSQTILDQLVVGDKDELSKKLVVVAAKEQPSFLLKF